MIKKILFFTISIYLLAIQVSAQNISDPEKSIKYIDIVHTTHTDYGYTDNPVIVIELQKRNLDIALDLAMESKNNPEGERFCWTAEVLDIFWRWWQEASVDRQEQMLEMIHRGQIAVNGLAFNVEPFLNKDLWNEMTHWIPQEMYQKFNISIGMENDVTGIPRAAAMHLMDNKINHIWMGINDAWGGPVYKLPTAFWWKMPDNRKIFVWSGGPYFMGATFFNKNDWRIAQREANNTQLWWPRENDQLASDDESVRKAHEYCLRRIKQLQKDGYSYDFMILPYTNMWRVDNDGPSAWIVPFVQKWNKLGLKPRLNLQQPMLR